jgi:RNA polymerase sigma-70 factor (ECF subfamily)
MRFPPDPSNLFPLPTPEQNPKDPRNARVPPASGTPDDAAEIPPGVLDRIRSGDEEAAREAVARLGPLVGRVVRRHLHRRDDAEDLMQDVFVKMFQNLDQYRGEVPFTHWVGRIALNTSLDRLRRHKVRPTVRWSELEPSEQATLEALASEAPRPGSADFSGARGLFERLMSGLDPKDAWLLRRIELEGASLAEACAEAGWNPTLTRVRLFRARGRLRRAFQELEEKP